MKEEFDRLIYDFLSGSITKEDLHKLNEWIYSDPENQKYFEQQKRIWLLSAEYKNVSVHEEQAYNRFAKRIRKHKSAPAGKMRRALFVKYAGYAAVGLPFSSFHGYISPTERSRGIFIKV